MTGDTYLYRLLHASGAEIMPPLVGGRTPLHEAVTRGHISMVRMMLREAKALQVDKNARDSSGKTPLHYAVIKSSVEIVALLLKHNAETEIADNEGKKALDYASSMQGPCAVELIEVLSIRESKLSLMSSEPSLKIKDSLETDASKLKITEKSTTEDPDNTTLISQLLEIALRETGVPIISSNELTFYDVINRGSSCVVIRAKWRGSDVAVKQFKLEYRNSKKDLQKFVAEMRVLAQIRHPNLLLLMGICLDQPQLSLVTEFVPNCTLFAAIHKTELVSLTDAARYKIAYQLVQGLLYLHANQPPIVHRDLKPENVLLDAKLEVKIADFGLARPLTRFRSEEQTTTCIGTTRFMAPELFDKTRSSKIGIEVDIWALGCILIELFASKRPWEYISSAKANQIYYEILHKKPVPIPSIIPKSIQIIIAGCCQYNPEERLTCSEVMGMLEEYRAELNSNVKTI